MLKSLLPNFITKHHGENKLSGDFKAATLFLDISGFTNMTEKLMKHGRLGAETLSEILNNIFHYVVGYIYRYDGFISTFAGDALTAIFIKGKTRSAVKAATEIQKFFLENQNYSTKLGDFLLKAKQGLSYGNIDWGILGSQKVQTFYFKGESINGAAVSEHLCPESEIVIDLQFKEQLKKEDVSIMDSPIAQEVPENHFILKKIPLFSLPRSAQIDYVEIKEEIYKLFFPDLFKGEISSEFRDLASVFIVFQGSDSFKKFNEIVTTTLDLSASFGGYLSSLDFGDKGSLMLFLFGAPVSFEDNIMRSADFGYAIKKEFSDKVKVGINYGTAYTGYVGSSQRSAYTALGDVVNLASRFVETAENSQVLVSKDIFSNVHREYKLDSIGEKEFKGKSQKIEVYELIGPIHFEDKGMHTGQFVNRKEEIEALNKLCEPFFNNEFAGLIYVYGPPGIGKSKLLYEFTKPLIDRFPLIVLQTDNILKNSLNPFISFFLEHFEITFEMSNEEKLENISRKIKDHLKEVSKLSDNKIAKKYAEEVDRTQSIIAGLLDIHSANSLYESIDPRNRFQNFLAAIKNFFILLCYIKPVLLVLEDAYGVDENSKKAFDYLMTDIQKVPLVIFASCRLNDDGSKPEFLTKNKHLEKSITLKYLQDNDSKELAESIFGKKIDENLTKFIVEKTENNPLYIEQSCAYLLENDLLEVDGSQYVLATEDAQLPGGISSIMISRIDRLSEKLKRLLQTATVLGKEFNIEILKKVSDLNEDEFQIAIQEGEKQKIWQKETNVHYAFAQGLLRDAAYEMQLNQNLQKIHSKIADELALYYKDNHTHYADISHHYEKAGDMQKAREYLTQAARYSHQNYKADKSESNKAVKLYQKLIEMIQDDPKEIILTHGRIAEVYEIAEDWDKAIQFLNKAVQFGEWHTIEDLETQKIIANLKAYLGEIYQHKNDMDSSINIIQESIQDAKKLNDTVTLGKAYLNLSKVYLQQKKYEDSMATLEYALEYKKSTNEPIGHGMALYYMGEIKKASDDHNASIKFYDHSRDVLKNVKDRSYLIYPLNGIANVHLRRGNLKKASKYLKECMKICKETNDVGKEVKILLDIGLLEIHKGNYKKALNNLLKSLKVAEMTEQKENTAYSLLHIGITHYKLKQYKENIEYFRRALKLMNEINMKDSLDHIYSYLTCTYARVGMANQSIKAAYFHIKSMKETGKDVEYGRTFLGLGLAIALNKSLSQTSKERLHEIKRYKDNLNNDISAEYFFKLAIDISQNSNYIFTLIPTLRSYGMYLLSQGKRQEAIPYLKQAKSKASSLGMDVEKKEIESLLKN